MKRDYDPTAPMHELALHPEFRWFLRVLGPEGREELIRRSMEDYNKKVAEILRDAGGKK